MSCVPALPLSSPRAAPHQHGAFVVLGGPVWTAQHTPSPQAASFPT